MSRQKPRDVVSLDQLQGIANFQHVTVEAKVTCAGDVVHVKDLTKQDFVIIDATVGWSKKIISSL